jgi:acyl carrier protein
VNDSLASKVRDVVAGHFEIPLDRLTDEARLRDDLGADQFDRIELIIAIEDQVPGIAIDDATIAGIETIGDLMRAIEGLAATGAPKRSGLGAAPQIES